MGRRERKTPAEVSARWPDSALADPVLESVRRYVVNLVEAIGEDSIRSAAIASEVNYSTLHAVVRGEAWPDAITVARTERGLGKALWVGPVDPPDRGKD